MKIKEGRRIKGGIPMDAVSPFIMVNRSDASNLFSASVNIEKCEQLIREKRAMGLQGFGMIHIFIAAYIRVVSQLPGINRFIRGQRVYSRNSIEICMAIKKSLKLNAPETVLKLSFKPDETLDSVYKKLSAEIKLNKNEGDQNGMDNAARILVKIPSIFLKFTIWFLKLLDYFGALPRKLTSVSPFHGSMFITNMGSLGIQPIFHHLYDFGNIPIFVAMGKKRTEYTMDRNGDVQKNRLIDFNIVCDERICDGHYYASAMKKMKKIIENPRQLINPPDKIVDDIK